MNIHLIVQQKLTCTTVVHVYACHGENTQVTPKRLAYIEKVKIHTTDSFDQFRCQKLLPKINTLSDMNLFTLIDKETSTMGPQRVLCTSHVTFSVSIGNSKFNQPYFMKIQPTVFLAVIMKDPLFIFQTAIIPVFIYVIICNATCL